MFGSVIATASSPSHHLVLTTYNHPELLLASGWVFVSLTGLFFKEFACFQRWEASALFALVPVLAGGHFLKLFPAPLELIIAEVGAYVLIRKLKSAELMCIVADFRCDFHLLCTPEIWTIIQSRYRRQKYL